MNDQTHYSEIEVQDLIAELSDSDIGKLLHVFRLMGCPPRAGLSDVDVLNHAITQALSLERPWPKGLSAATYLHKSGWSHISNEEEKHFRNIGISEIGDVLRTPEVVDSITSRESASSPKAEQQIEERQVTQIIQEWTQKILSLFENDGDATCFLKQKLAEIKRNRILELCNLTDQTYRNVEKRIKDKVRKRFPNGFPWWEVTM